MSAPVAPSVFTPVDTKVAVGNLAASKNSGLARCSFSAGMPVVRLAIGRVIDTFDAERLALSSVSVPVGWVMTPILLVKPIWS